MRRKTGMQEQESEMQDRDIQEQENEMQDRDIQEQENEMQDRDIQEQENETQDRETQEQENETQDRETQEQENEMQDRDIQEQENETQDRDIQEQERDLEEEESESQGIDYFARPEPAMLQAFLDYHPQQNTSNAVVMRVFSRKDGSSRKWLTYCKERHLLFCFVCLAFARRTDTSTFITGMSDWRHVHVRTEEHEKSTTHKTCAEAFFLRCSKGNINSLFAGSQLSAHRAQVKKRRQVLERIVDVVKVLGKRGLSYRHVENEAAYTLSDNTVDHGNFLELIVLLGKYDACLREHLNDCIEKSKKSHQSSGSKGRGSLITLLSKTTVNSVIDALGHLIQESITSDVKKAGMFSIQLDTTQDITGYDQCSVIIRYVTEAVQERLVSIVRCEAFTGQYFVNLLCGVLEHLKLDHAMCIGNATDGASNMQGQYKGFSALMAAQSPTHVHVWCYAHILNLVLADTTQSVIESGSLFNLLNDIAVFIKESYHRVNLWEKQTQEKARHRRLSPICETRWWAKHDALQKIFGHFGKPEDGLFLDVVLTLEAIEKREKEKPAVRAKARGFKESLLKHETVLTAQIFLRVFEQTTPLSKYLQSKGMDILSAHHMVTVTQDSLKSIARDFPTVKEAADRFVKQTNQKLEEKEEHTDMEVEAALPEKRVKKRKSMAGEMSEDESQINAEKTYEVKVHNIILDTVIEAIHRRFDIHGPLLVDLAWLDPRKFSQIRTGSLPRTALQNLSTHLLKFDSSATVNNLQSELICFAGQWERLKTSLVDDYRTRTAKDRSEELEEDSDIVTKSCKSCKDCPLCCYQILRRFNLLSDAYHLLGLAYKYLLTLSLTQVACERTFSTLKFIKSRLRSSLSANRLEMFMLMATEKDILMSMDSDMVIDKVAEKSDLLRKLLL
nr:52 kDa repressor of the inhibitor of the protein kinase-like [Nothobranchius furzeri]